MAVCILGCMNEILQANIFFFIASVGVVLFMFFTCVALYHLIKIIRSVRRIVERIEAGSETVAEDLRELRETFSPTRLFSLLLNLTGMGTSRSGRRRRVRDDDEEDA